LKRRIALPVFVFLPRSYPCLNPSHSSLTAELQFAAMASFGLKNATANCHRNKNRNLQKRMRDL
jgi:hypothetical protein